MVRAMFEYGILCLNLTELPEDAWVESSACLSLNFVELSIE